MAIKAGNHNISSTRFAVPQSQVMQSPVGTRLRPHAAGLHAKQASRLRQQQRPLLAEQLPREPRAKYMVVSSSSYTGMSSEHAKIKVIGVGRVV